MQIFSNSVNPTYLNPPHIHTLTHSDVQMKEMDLNERREAQKVYTRIKESCVPDKSI